MGETLTSYWSPSELVTNTLLLFHLIGATAVGLLLGYERSYHGRAAGMRTYALVCVTSTMLTVINAYPHQWYGGQFAKPGDGRGRSDPRHPRDHDRHRLSRCGRDHERGVHDPRPFVRRVDLGDGGDRRSLSASASTARRSAPPASRWPR